MPQTRSTGKSSGKANLKSVQVVDTDDSSSVSGSSIIRDEIEVSSPLYFNLFMSHFWVQEAQAGLQKLKQRLKTLLRENNSLKLELEFKSASNETHNPLEDGSESSETRVQELEKTVKALKEVTLSQRSYYYYY